MKRKPSPIPVRLQRADVPDISYRTKYRFQGIAVALDELARDQMEPDLSLGAASRRLTKA